jgi:hypothetical protein
MNNLAVCGDISRFKRSDQLFKLIGKYARGNAAMILCSEAMNL